jgi:16S rRNA (adenine1518-N6/adenine1519-N6)-dimethyltransferase
MGDTAIYTKRVLQKYGISPKKSLGQVFIISDGHIRKMVEAITPHEDDLIIEIGGGLGALTRHLAVASEVVAFEIDEKLCDILNTELPNVLVINRDFLEVDLGLFVEAYLRHSNKPVKVCGNLPYNVSTQILIRIATTDTPYVNAHFLVQKEVGAKISCKPGEGDFGRISAMVQTFCTIERLFDVPAGAFVPMPKVDSTYLRLKHREDHTITHEDIPHYAAFVKGAFAQRRKSLFNNLRRSLELAQKIEQDALIEEIEALGGSRNTRPEEITADKFAELYYRLMARVLIEDDDLPL